eukprot:Gb_35683 [translate_table: standard]
MQTELLHSRNHEIELDRSREDRSYRMSNAEETEYCEKNIHGRNNASIIETLVGETCKGVEGCDLKDTAEKICEEIEDHVSNMDIGGIAMATEECPSNMDVVGIAEETEDCATNEDLMEEIEARYARKIVRKDYGKPHYVKAKGGDTSTVESDVEDVVSPKVLKGLGFMWLTLVHEEGKVVGQVNYIDGYLDYDEYVPMVNNAVDGGWKLKGHGKNCYYQKVLRDCLPKMKEERGN